VVHLNGKSSDFLFAESSLTGTVHLDTLKELLMPILEEGGLNDMIL
jgi:hypothetical protein